jgi:hypothetical protein
MTGTCCPVEVHRGFEGTYYIHRQNPKVNQVRNQSAGCNPVSCLAYFSAMKMEAASSSETAMKF